MPHPERIEQIIRCLVAGSWVESKLLNSYQSEIVNEMAAAGMSSHTAAGYLLKFLPEGNVRADLQSQINDAIKLEYPSDQGDCTVMGVA